jgi:signal-transduction protein with cAMP-binding, CBS, and nucleotidyltransferase domain
METMLQQNNKKEDKISKIIDKILQQVFGEEATSLIYKYLKNNYSLKQDEIAEKIEVFTMGLEALLKSGANVIEQKILEDIYVSYSSLRRLELEKLQEDCDFISQIKSFIQKS